MPAYSRQASPEDTTPEAWSAEDDIAPSRRESADLRDFMNVLLARWKTIVLCAVVTTCLGLAYLSTTHPSYTATVSILIDARPRSPVGSDAQVPLGATPDTTLVESLVKVIASDTVLRRVVEREGLADDPEFVSTRPGLRARLFAMLGMSSTAPPPPGEDRTTRAVLALSRAVVVKRSERTYVIDVDVSSADPAKAARLANAVADAYVADQQDAHRINVSRDSRFLNQRLPELKSRLMAAEDRAQEFRAKNNLTDANGKSISETELADLTADLGRARARTIDTKTRWDRMRQVAAAGRTDNALADASKSAVLDKLRGQYADTTRQLANLRTTLGERHPALLEAESQLRDTKRLIDVEIKRIIDAAGSDYQIARAAEAETAQRVQQARLATQTQNQAMVQMRELDRDVDATREVYEKLLRSRDTTDTESGDGPQARVIAPALTPLAPSSPKTTAILFASIASGLFGGIGVALLGDYLNWSTIVGSRREEPESPEEPVITDAPPVIGAAPRIAPRLDWLAALKGWTLRSRVDELGSLPSSHLAEIVEHPDSPFSIAIRDLFRRVDAPRKPRHARPYPRTILVTSALPGCGKTTIAANLARAAAQAGQRALLIDANSENPSLAEIVAPGSKAGLIDLGVETRPVYALGPSFHVMPIDENENEAAARLAKQRDVEYFDGIAGNFEFVVIDGPTIEAEDQARALAEAVDSIIFVSGNRAGGPSLDEILDLLDVPESKMAGTMLSMVEASKAA